MLSLQNDNKWLRRSVITFSTARSLANSTEDTTMKLKNLHFAECRWIIHDIHVDIKDSDLSKMNLTVAQRSRTGFLRHLLKLDVFNSSLGYTKASDVHLKMVNCQSDNMKNMQLDIIYSRVIFSDCIFYGTERDPRKNSSFMLIITSVVQILNSTFASFAHQMPIIMSNHSNMSIEHSYFLTNSDWIAICYTSNIFIMNSVFERNVAGLFIANNSYLAVYNSSFDYNHANIRHDEKAIISVPGLIKATSNVTIVVNQSSFSHNVASSGGVLEAEFDVKIVVESSHFEQNEGLTGGAIYALGNVTLLISQTIFLQNYANIKWKPKFLNKEYESNSVGGAISISYNSLLIINDSTFQNNTSSLFGGAIYVLYNSTLYIQSSTFDGNMAEIGGAIMASDNSAVLANNTNFTKNRAIKSSNPLAVSDLSDGTFAGAVSGQSNVTLTFVSCEFVSNMAESAGTIFVSVSSQLIIYSSSFYNNMARNGGIIQGLFEVQITMKDTHIFENDAESNLIFIPDPDPGRLSMLEISECYIFENGAGIIAIFNIQHMIVTKSKFIGNYGGEIITVVNAGFLKINNSSFERNNRSLILSSGESRIFIDGCSFSKNMAEKGSVLLAMSQSNITITNSAFIQNKVRNKGGVMCFEFVKESEYSYIDVINSEFTGNTAGHLGAVLYILSEGEVVFDSCSFTENEGSTDSALYIVDIRVLRTANTIFHNFDKSGMKNKYAIKYDSTGDITAMIYKTLNTEFVSNNDSMSILSSSSNFVQEAVAKGFLSASLRPSINLQNFPIIHEETVFASGEYFGTLIFCSLTLLLQPHAHQHVSTPYQDHAPRCGFEKLPMGRY